MNIIMPHSFMVGTETGVVDGVVNAPLAFILWA